MRIRSTIVLGVMLMLSGCGAPAQSDQSAAATATLPPTMTPTPAPTLPSCAKQKPAVAVPPQDLPPLPWPAAMHIIEFTRLENQVIRMSATAPGTIDSMAVHWDTILPTAGYTATFSEAEPGESEGAFVGHDRRVRWIAYPMTDCDGAVLLLTHTRPY